MDDHRTSSSRPTSLFSGLKNRSGSRTKLNTKSSSSSSLPKTPIQYVTVENADNLRIRIEELEHRIIYFDKILNTHHEHIQELHNKVKQFENEKHRHQIANLINKNQFNYPPNNNYFNNRSLMPSVNTISLNGPQIVPTKSKSSESRSSVIPSATNEPSSSTTTGYQQQHQSIVAIPEKRNKWAKIMGLFKSRPTLDSLKKKNIYKNEACFDTELENVIKHDEYPTIPKIVIECIRLIEIKALLLPPDGLYRMSGSYAEIQKIRFSIDNNDYECLKNVKDIHTLVGVLKLFFREIKSPLIKISEIRLFIGSEREWTTSSITDKIDTLKRLIQSLPEQNRDTLCYFLKHLRKLTHMPLQFMNAESLAVSVTPTIFHFTVCDKPDIHKTLKETEILTSCTAVFIEYQSQIFESKTKSLTKSLSRCMSYPCLN